MKNNPYKSTTHLALWPLCVLFVLAFPGFAKAQPKVPQGVRYTPGAGQLHVSIDLDVRSNFLFYHLSNPARLVLEVSRPAPWFQRRSYLSRFAAGPVIQASASWHRRERYHLFRFVFLLRQARPFIALQGSRLGILFKPWVRSPEHLLSLEQKPSSPTQTPGTNHTALRALALAQLNQPETSDKGWRALMRQTIKQHRVALARVAQPPTRQDRTKETRSSYTSLWSRLGRPPQARPDVAASTALRLLSHLRRWSSRHKAPKVTSWEKTWRRYKQQRFQGAQRRVKPSAGLIAGWGQLETQSAQQEERLLLDWHRKTHQRKEVQEGALLLTWHTESQQRVQRQARRTMQEGKQRRARKKKRQSTLRQLAQANWEASQREEGEAAQLSRKALRAHATRLENAEGSKTPLPTPPQPNDNSRSTAPYWQKRNDTVQSRRRKRWKQAQRTIISHLARAYAKRKAIESGKLAAFQRAEAARKKREEAREKRQEAARKKREAARKKREAARIAAKRREQALALRRKREKARQKAQAAQKARARRSRVAALPKRRMPVRRPIERRGGNAGRPKTQRLAMLQREASQRPAPTLLDVFEDVVPLTQKPPWYKRKREGGQNTTASKEGVRLISVQVTQRVGWDRLVLRLRSSSGRKPRVRIYRRAGGVLQLYLLNTSIASGVQKGKRVVKHPYSALHSVELKSLATDRRVVVFVRFRSKIPSYQHKRVDGGWEFLFRRTIGD